MTLGWQMSYTTANRMHGKPVTLIGYHFGRPETENPLRITGNLTFSSIDAYGFNELCLREADGRETYFYRRPDRDCFAAHFIGEQGRNRLDWRIEV